MAAAPAPASVPSPQLSHEQAATLMTSMLTNLFRGLYSFFFSGISPSVPTRATTDRPIPQRQIFGTDALPPPPHTDAGALTEADISLDDRISVLDVPDSLRPLLFASASDSTSSRPLLWIVDSGAAFSLCSRRDGP